MHTENDEEIDTMGNYYSKSEEDRLRYISREIRSLRSGLKTSPQNISKEKKDYILKTLAQRSSEVESMHRQVKPRHIDEMLRNISETIEEVLRIEPSELDGGAVESDSFVNVTLKRERSRSLNSLGSSKNNVKSQTAVSRRTVPTLREMETKLDALKSEVNYAIDNNDSEQLKVLLQNIKSLADILEPVHTKGNTSLERRKESARRKIMHMHSKANKALNEMTKYETSQNQSRLQRKNKSMADLSTIEVQLVENQSLLGKSINDKNSVDVARIRNNIVECKQKLCNIDLVDDEVKENAAFLSQKITETMKSLDNLMAKREFDSKFAKFLEAFERVTRNFDASTNAEDTVNQLQRLRNSIENLEEINDTTKNRKTHLLFEVKRQISSINEALQKRPDEEIIKEIVEDNVILRKNAQSMDAEYTIIDELVNHWNNVITNFDVNCYSNLSLLRIDGHLGQMQQSINNIRVDIANKCDTNVPSTLNTKHSQSTPRLNNRRSYGSNRSLDQLDKRTRQQTNTYHTSTHFENRDKIKAIEQQVRYMKEKMNEGQSNSTLRDKLKLHLKDLDKFINYSDKTVASYAQLVHNEIVELLCKSYLSELKYQTHMLFKRVQNFNGTRYDKEFDEVKRDLFKMQLNLENFSIPSQFDSLTKEKVELAEELCCVIESLQEKGSHHKKYEGEDVEYFKGRLLDLKEKVKRFSGTYKSTPYNNIERELTKLLLDVGERIEDKEWFDEITKETEKLLNILKQRSHAVQSFKSLKPGEKELADQAEMAEIKQDLLNIKKQIDRTPENNVDAFVRLQIRLDSVNLELSQISARSNENLAKEKEFWMNEVQTLRNVVNAKVALQQKPALQWPERVLQSDLLPYPKNDVNTEFEQIENSFFIIKKEIAAPSNEEDFHKYYKLAQDIKNLKEKLSRHTFPAGTDVHIKQQNTLREMQAYVELLEKEAFDVNYVLSIEEKIDQLKSLFESEQKYDLQAMARELQTIQKKLKEHQLNSRNELLRSRKTSVQQITDDLTQKLRKLGYSENEELIEESRKIEDCEGKVRAFAPEILSFSGLKTDDKFYELNESTIRMIIVLDKLQVKNADLQTRRIKLLKDLHTLGHILDDRAEQIEKLFNFEQELDNISMMISRSVNNNEEMQLIRSKMEELESQLQGLKVAENIASRKNACLEKFHALINRFMELEKSVTAHSKVVANIAEQSSRNFSTQAYSFTDHAANSKNDTSGERDTFARIASDVENIITAVNATNNKNQLQNFEDSLAEYTKEIKNLEIKRDSPQYPRVLELYQNIENLSQLIEEKIHYSDFFSYISNEIEQIFAKMDTLLTHEQISQLHNELVRLQGMLGKIDSAAMKSEKDENMMRIILCLQKITDSRKADEGTTCNI